jgi:membrane protein YqaA with SNARE-associated domain
MWSKTEVGVAMRNDSGDVVLATRSVVYEAPVDAKRLEGRRRLAWLSLMLFISGLPGVPDYVRKALGWLRPEGFCDD